MSLAIPPFTSIYEASPFYMKPSKVAAHYHGKPLTKKLPEHQNKIHPIPMIYGKGDQKKYDSKFHKTLAMKGHKYVSQVVAIGPLTDTNLKRINQSPLKVMRSLDFDGSLDNSSGIKSLSEVLRKIRMPIKDMSLVIRRVERLNETDILSPLLRRRKGMKKFKIEFSSTVQVNGQGIRVFAKGLKKCYSLTSLEAQLSYLLDFGEGDCNVMGAAIKKLPKLEHLKYFVHVFDTLMKEEDAKVNSSASWFRNLKTATFRSFAKTGWTLMTDAPGQFLVKLFKSLPHQMNPIDFSWTFHNMPVPTEVFQELTVAFSRFENLQNVFLEFAFCKLEPLDLFVFAGGMKDCNRIRQLTFKYKETRILFAECLCQFIKAIAKLDFLEKFDLFFRKITCPDAERDKMREFLSAIENIEFVITKESLHVSRKYLSIK